LSCVCEGHYNVVVVVVVVADIIGPENEK